MANLNQVQIPVSKGLTATTAALLDAAVAAQVNTLAKNTIGNTDSAGAPSGTQTVYPNSIQISPYAAYLDAVPALHFVCTITWSEAVQLT